MIDKEPSSSVRIHMGKHSLEPTSSVRIHMGKRTKDVLEEKIDKIEDLLDAFYPGRQWDTTNYSYECIEVIKKDDIQKSIVRTTRNSLKAEKTLTTAANISLQRFWEVFMDGDLSFKN